MKFKYFITSLLFAIIFFLPVKSTLAIYDPTSVANNKLGVHIISPTSQESSPAAALVNSSGGDWGYVTLVIESKNRDEKKYQAFFDDLRRRHLIPLVRLATQAEKDYWKRPDPNEEIAWAQFLDKLNWPTKNRYVIVYNEPNHGLEWGSQVDAADYAHALDKTITALKDRSPDFFVLNAGLDASTPHKLPAYEDELTFLQQMNQAVPGIFNRLDGWVSHSYPNPNFSGSPSAQGRGSVRTYFWELENLNNLGVNKNLPVFITETGWKHAEGINYDPSLPTAEVVGDYLKTAFQTAWSSSRIVAVTPFLLNYQQSPFDHFSFKKIESSDQNLSVLGVEFPDYYKSYLSLRDLPKVAGRPIQENRAQLTKGEIYSTLVAGQSYNIALTFKNTGQSIWNEYENVRLVPSKDAGPLQISPVLIPADKKIEPGQDYTFYLTLTAPPSGSFNIELNLYEGNKQFINPPLEFTTEVKSPVVLKIKANLQWKKDFSGEYILSVVGAAGNSAQQIILNSVGSSDELEARYLLPEYGFDFSLERPFYQAKPLHQVVHSGVNTLDFGELKPDISSAILDPKQLWQLLPWSN